MGSGRAAIVTSAIEISKKQPRPVAFCVVAAATGLSERAAVTAYLYDDLAMVAGAAVRLLPVDSADAFRRLADAEPELQRLSEEVLAASLDPRELPSSFAPAHELRSLEHASAEGRLFAS